MSIILLVPGESEYTVLPSLLQRIGISVKAIVTKCVTYNQTQRTVSVTPKVYRQVKAAFIERPRKIILIFDGENAPLCPPKFASKIKSDIIKNISLTQAERNMFSVVCANHSVENWILADLNVFKSNLFKRDLSNRIADGSDCKPAQSIIREGFNKQYQKVRHLKELTRYFNPNREGVRGRSRSFDKFLKEAGV